MIRTKNIGDGYTITEYGDVYNKYNKKLNPCDNGKGYLMVNIYINKKRKCKAIHRLLAESFIPNPNNLPEVNHIDANRKNNSLSNLEWVTHGQNIKHSFNLQNRTAVGSNNANSIYKENIVIEICILLEKGFKASQIRDKGYPYSLVRAIKSKKNWSHISDNYNY